ncbi:MAG: hypothetical protein A3K19_32900 [Lentisphaerae bacterium RIFOXYB12_FULL_65_16]|nr:MAG: hypothetical protein A3K18_21110 [Lentisphaerae bacterium RIFOXYA12_64_32]OGV93514.1 MAG: hypothetical protein A3K19_32900 [Lentisphaerae bacterium RIFOXYB12_FULL_65_16]
MRRLLAGIGAGLLLLGAPANWAQENVSTADLMKVIQEQNKKIEALTQRIQQLESRQAPAPAGDTSQIKAGLTETNEALAATNKKLDALDHRLILGKGIDGLKLTGDLRVRYEQRDRHLNGGPEDSSKGDQDRARFRSRLRLGGIWTNKDEGWEVGAGVATGEKNDDRSTNDTWGHDSYIFEKGNLYLDYAYAKHTWTDPFGSETFSGPVSLTLGQQKNPLISTLVTWDGDINPAGFTAQYGDPKGKEYKGPFLTLGAYVLSYTATGQKIDGDNQEKWDDNVWLYASQLGYAHKSDSFDALGLIGCSHVTSTYRNIAAAAWANTNSSNPNTAWGGADSGYEYQVGEVYGEVKTSVSGIELKPYGHVAMNFGADGNMSQAKNNATSTTIDPSHDNLAWMLGLDLKRGKWSLGYGYAYIEADAVFGPAREGDFGETTGLNDTDLQGHVIKLAYAPLKNLSLGTTLYLLERIEDVKSTEADKAQLLQFDASYKF